MPSARQPVIFAHDATETDLAVIRASCSDAFDAPSAATQPYGDLARIIREALDKHAGVGWNVVVGKSFGGAVTHKFKKYAALSMLQGIEILVWRV